MELGAVTPADDAFVGLEVARRFEALDAEYAGHMVALRARSAPASGAGTLERAGATCAWFGPESVLSHVFGLGLGGDVTEADLDAIEAFYRAKGDGRVQVEFCPFAKQGTLDRLGARGYRATGFEQVMACRIPARPAAPSPGSRLDVVVVPPDSETGLAEWARVAGEGFFAPDRVPRALEGVFELTPRLPGTTVFLARVDGEPAAAAGVTVRHGLASLFGGATLPAFRRAGAHSALLAERLALAARAGAEWATAGALPGSISQRNMERLGFRVAYTRPVLGKTL
jgi:ribosomal protein S18 acetylase RimI-like enzyme